ncbi:NACHT, LRR and PYD domains-containing protein 3 isoform X2 [Esox lucius]|uniref:NACHT, LRR and PYD domains-containing protein 3 isoform X2 n=1 Tax=Esox lucius TaxID=8010 RepID=UPI001476D547|nr:NACHT, LRR and PYD domains-containing protein 3 isoform X2 [Esox lucius]
MSQDSGSESQSVQNPEPLQENEKEMESLGSEDASNITYNLMDMRSQIILRTQQDIKAKLTLKYKLIREGTEHQGNQNLLKNMYTELYITEGGSLRLCKEHVQKGVSKATLKKRTTFETAIKCNDIIKPKQRERLHRYSIPGDLHKGIFLMNMDATAPSSPRSDRPPLYAPYHKKRKKRKGFRNLTKGIAGIGKTVSVQKVILDWAEGTANQDIHFIFPLPFRDLNLMKDQYSLMTLLSHYFPELKEIDRIEDGETKTVFIFDGLNECRFPLDFKNNKKFYDVTESTSVDVLLTNLIEGNLFPSAHIWITTRPAAAYQIPPEYVDQVTEIRGFSEPQKEEYFRKKITDQNLAIEIIKHIKSSRSLHIMCHLPVFCWISATVLETMLKETEKNEIPKTLTQMYSHFLLIQISVKNKKYNKDTETNPKDLSQADKELIFKLAKLAFQQLQKGNLIFYEEDLRECGVDVTEASEYSSLCTEIFKEESGLNPEKVFSFVHLSIQEFLAAVHALESCLCKEEDVFLPKPVSDKVYNDYYDDDKETKSDKLYDDDGKTKSDTFYDEGDDDDDDDDGGGRASDKLSNFHRRAVDQSLKSKNGHLDLFLRFLMGLSLESNQNLLHGLLTQTGSSTLSNEETVKRTVEYISDKIKKESSPERVINLFHCQNELGANSLVEDMQTSLQSGTLSGTRLQPHQCSALSYLLLMSEEVLEVFSLNMYNTSEEAYQRLLPLVNICKRAVFDYWILSYEFCETLTSVLQTPDSTLRELDISHNKLSESKLKLLCAGNSPFCNIQTLVLAGCNLTYKSCKTLASALQTTNCPLRELDLRKNHLGDRGLKQLCSGPVIPLRNIQTLVLAGCNLTYKSCKTLASALQTPNSAQRKLILGDNDLGDRGVKLLCPGLTSPFCNLQTLDLNYCGLTEDCCSALAFVLRSPKSQLKHLELRENNLQDSGVRLLSAGLEDPNCKLQTLGLDYCNLTYKSCETLASALGNQNCPLRELVLSYNHLGDRGVKLLCAGLTSPLCNIQTLDLDYCGLTEDCCSDLVSVLHAPNSQLKQLELRDNDLKDSGVRLLSAGLEDPNCELQTLGLAGCLVTEEGCAALVSALRSNPSHLRNLDLSYNRGVPMGGGPLSTVLKDPSYKLTELKVDDGRDICFQMSSSARLEKPKLRVERLHNPGKKSLRTHLFYRNIWAINEAFPSTTQTETQEGHTLDIEFTPEVPLEVLNTSRVPEESQVKCGPERWIPPSCKTCDFIDDSTWLPIEPLTSTLQGVKTFSQRTPKGRYECSVSGLRWVCEMDVILKYHFRSWEPYSELLTDMQFTPVGPLLEITKELGELEEVHLPHFVCLGTKPSLRNEMRILHLEEHGVSFEEVNDVTRFHAKLLHPKFSALSVIMSDPSQKQAVEQQEEQFQGSSRIPISRPEEAFKLNNAFRLQIPTSIAINPEMLKLQHRKDTPSFFRVVMKNTGVDIEMELIGEDERTVWKDLVPKDEYLTDSPSNCAVLEARRPAESSPAEQQLRSVRSEFVIRVSEPVLNSLLDGLLQDTVINQEEMDSVKVNAERAEKARKIMDMVLRKGTESSSRMIVLLWKMDPYLCTQLQLSVQGPS